MAVMKTDMFVISDYTVSHSPTECCLNDADAQNCRLLETVAVIHNV